MSRKVRLICSYTILLILSILLFLFTYLLIFKYTLLDYNYVLNSMNKSNYYVLLYDDIKNEMSYYTAPSGFKNDILDNTFSIDDVKKHTNLFVKSVYLGSEFNIDTSCFVNNLNNNIDNFLVDENFIVVNKDEIKMFSDEMSKIYRNKVTFMGISNDVSKYIKKVSFLCNSFILIISIVMILLFLINRFIFKSNKTDVVFFSNTFLIIAFNIFIKDKIDINNIFIYSSSFSSVILKIINNIISILVIVVILYFIIGLTLSIFKRNDDVDQNSILKKE